MKITLVDKIVLLVAKRCSGKSILLRHLVECEKEKFDKIFVVSPTEGINHYYKNAGITTEEYVFEEYSEAFAEKLITKLSKENEGGIKTRVLLILDDLISELNFASSLSLRKIFSRGRHIGLSLVQTSQYLNAMSPLQRNNCDTILVGQSTNHSLDVICDEFLSGNITKHEFKEFYNKATQKFGFVVISNQSSQSGDVNEIFGSVRVPAEFI